MQSIRIDLGFMFNFLYICMILAEAKLEWDRAVEAGGGGGAGGLELMKLAPKDPNLCFTAGCRV